MLLGSVLIGSSLLGAMTAEALTATTFNVTATVVQSCAITANDLSFGNINVVTGSDFAQATTINLTCGAGVAYNLGLDAGQGQGSNTTTRVMTNTSNGATLNYALYQDNNHTINWGNANGTDTNAGTGNGGPQQLVVYGDVLAGQTTVPYGTYADVITVNVYY